MPRSLTPRGQPAHLINRTSPDTITIQTMIAYTAEEWFRVPVAERERPRPNTPAYVRWEAARRRAGLPTRIAKEQT